MLPLFDAVVAVLLGLRHNLADEVVAPGKHSRGLLSGWLKLGR
ncbi:MAG TPA: hypothetical protein VJT72_02530 [Pseudonocardiaceae bacterium]|nr:hypothetical protein [Pseudonocardiaceae bacterium]